MNILVIGGGGREHAITHALAVSESAGDIYVAPGNPGILTIAKKADIDINNFNAVAQFCKANDITLVVVGPEQPLADGMADALTKQGIFVFGPMQKAAMLEASKGFAKDFMAKYKIPTAAYETFDATQKTQAIDFIKANFPVVLKADGLAGGKGVLIPETADEAISQLDEMFGGMFGSASERIVIEEFMEGEEASVFAICDGKDFVTLAPSQDHKRAFDGDLGLNTGGMGAYAPAKVATDEVIAIAHKDIIAPVLEGMKSEGSPYIGCLYAGLMIKDGNPRVVEFNVRFGDPETQAVLAILDADFAGLLDSAAKGKLDKSTIRSVASKSACCVVMASEGYPGKCESGFEINGIEEASNDNLIVYQAGTKDANGKVVSNGGRVLGVTGLGSNLQEAIDKAYIGVKKIDFNNHFYRNDIGKKGL